MGFYLNNAKAYTIYKNETRKPYFVDKSMILQELCPLVEQGNNHICITRPRRFGKTVMANMVGAFFSKEQDSHELFEKLAIRNTEYYEKHINSHNVIYIDFSQCDDECTGYKS